MFEGICEALTREMELLEEKYSSGKASLNGSDLEHIDKMAHALKSLKAYEAMEGSSGLDSGYSRDSYDSYARGRSRTTGRYMSREGGYPPGDGRRY